MYFERKYVLSYVNICNVCIRMYLYVFICKLTDLHFWDRMYSCFAYAKLDLLKAQNVYYVFFACRENQYKNILGAKISKPLDLPLHGVKTIFVELDNTKIELLEPIGENSPIKKFLLKNPSGGMHHICYEVSNIQEACAQLESEGATLLGSGKPTIGAHGKPVIFIHPKDFNGTLIELEEV